MLQHIAISISKITDTDVFVDKLKRTTEEFLKRKIPILTLNLPETDFDKLNRIIALISSWEKIHSEKIKVNFFGKWYDLAWRVVEEIKNLIDETKDYDGFFLNLCIAYDGQEEIVDACRLLAKQAKIEKISPDNISKTDIKDNIYTSAFMPPQKIFILGGRKSIGGFLLWDSEKADIIFLDKHFDNINTEEII
ncbi:MAG TPA: hypothetical protein ENF94_01295 [Candidatus Woesearchaeota archaeon]|nr:MAG: hypothetical protein DRJ25_02935 [Candidatus Woesearchaeota archaeon]HDD70776.1 hypothetical protein [Candidatus Woesearchaeota archaeon]